MNRLSQIPATVSLHQLLLDHIESHRRLTGRDLDFQMAAIHLDKERGVFRGQAQLPCDCKACVAGWLSANADDDPEEPECIGECPNCRALQFATNPRPGRVICNLCNHERTFVPELQPAESEC